MLSLKPATVPTARKYPPLCAGGYENYAENTWKKLATMCDIARAEFSAFSRVFPCAKILIQTSAVQSFPCKDAKMRMVDVSCDTAGNWKLKQRDFSLLCVRPRYRTLTLANQMKWDGYIGAEFSHCINTSHRKIRLLWHYLNNHVATAKNT